MSSNPYLKDITNSSTKTPPKPVEKVFEEALAKAMKSLPKKYAGLDIRPYPSYEQKDASWIAKVAVTAWFEMTGSGLGARYI